MIKIHREGYRILLVIFLILAALVTTTFYVAGGNTLIIILSLVVALLLQIFFLRFFRKPSRSCESNSTKILSPADGKVVVIEETEETEYFKDRRIQISVFMSVWNVHINWFPISGLIAYYKYHPGKYLVARHPKSSTENERNTMVIQREDGKEILVRQIAGIVARKISSYARQTDQVNQGNELGFIKFGSRVDVFLPLDAEIKVKLGEHVKGIHTVLAQLK